MVKLHTHHLWAKSHPIVAESWWLTTKVICRPVWGKRVLRRRTLASTNQHLNSLMTCTHTQWHTRAPVNISRQVFDERQSWTFLVQETCHLSAFNWGNQWKPLRGRPIRGEDIKIVAPHWSLLERHLRIDRIFLSASHALLCCIVSWHCI